MIELIAIGAVAGFAVSLVVRQQFYKRTCHRHFRDLYNQQMDHLILEFKAEQNKLRQRVEDHQALIQAEIDKLMADQSIWHLEDTKEVSVSSNMEAMLQDEVV